MRSLYKYLMVIIIIMFFYAIQRISVIRLGYDVERLKKEVKNLEQINKGLLIERASLTSSERIETLALSYLGLKKPDSDQIVLIEKQKDDETGSLYASVQPSRKDFTYPFIMAKFFGWRP